MRRILQERSIPAWCAQSDPDFGGYRVGVTSVERSSHHLLVTARLLWTFSHAIRRDLSPDVDLEDAARTGYRCLRERLRDEDHGGFFWRVAGDGGSTDRAKYLYGQAFAIYGLVEYYRATGEQGALDLAVETFRIVMDKAHDEAHGGWNEHFDHAWKPMVPSTTVPIEIVGRKSANAHLHWMEALTELAMEIESDEVMAALGETLDLNRRYFYPETVFGATAWRRPDWRRMWFRRPADTSWGHFVEAAWLCIRADHALGRPISWNHFDRILSIAARYGVDARDGGLVARSSIFRRVVDQRRIWWAQAEWLVALTTAVEREPLSRWSELLYTVCEWLLASQIDPSDGVWIANVTSGDRADGKSGPWKAGYHEVRAMTIFTGAFLGASDAELTIFER